MTIMRDEEMTIIVEFLHPRANEDHVGLIPYWLDEDNPASAKQQIHDNYSHGGGWFSIPGFELDDSNVLHYPGDPAFAPLARMRLRDELILVYEHAIVAIIQPDRTFEVSRID